MPIPQEKYKTWSIEFTLGAGVSGVQTLLAAPGTGRQIVVTFAAATVVTSAAQTADLSIGSMNILRVGASPGVATEPFVGPLVRGLQGPANTALTLTPSAAGLGLHVVAEGYYLPS